MDIREKCPCGAEIEATNVHTDSAYTIGQVLNQWRVDHEHESNPEEGEWHERTPAHLVRPHG